MFFQLHIKNSATFGCHSTQLSFEVMKILHWLTLAFQNCCIRIDYTIVQCYIVVVVAVANTSWWEGGGGKQRGEYR